MVAAVRRISSSASTAWRVSIWMARTSFLRAGRICSYSLTWMRVPRPWLEKTSPSRPSSSVPLMRCTRGTPAWQAAAA